jgi:CBS domain-containing protein
MNSILIFLALIGWILAAYCYVQFRSSKVLKKPAREVIPTSEVRRRILDKHQQIRRLSEDLRVIEKSSIQVGDVMTENVCYASELTRTEDVLLKMHEQRTRHLIVQNEWGCPIGIISNRDLIVPGRTAKDVMTPDPITVSTTSPLGHAVALMLSHRISCLPVTDHEVLRGIITTTDLLMVLDCLLQFQEEAAARAGISTGKEEPFAVTQSGVLFDAPESTSESPVTV